MIYFCFVQGDVTSVAHPEAQGEVQRWGLQPSTAAPAGQSRLQANPEGRKLLLLRDKKNPRAPHHYPGADPTPLRGSRFTFYTGPWEVRPGNRHILTKLELMGSKFFTVSATCGAQHSIPERKVKSRKRGTLSTSRVNLDSSKRTS